ncbi:methyl-CpG-binding domain protein 2-like [Dromiciops gliroides]|uniref:methyl-CpG-binding domain protein 2-like n=1 Tax=Dromiciops gliroides TaxID=33562 RepID=UPI001CC69988|nr:methyl-CpG-binding domain protein 2-like [Dromiciops gliroides]
MPHSALSPPVGGGEQSAAWLRGADRAGWTAAAGTGYGRAFGAAESARIPGSQSTSPGPATPPPAPRREGRARTRGQGDAERSRGGGGVGVRGGSMCGRGRQRPRGTRTGLLWAARGSGLLDTEAGKTGERGGGRAETRREDVESAAGLGKKMRKG